MVNIMVNVQSASAHARGAVCVQCHVNRYIMLQQVLDCTIATVGWV